MTGLVKNTRGAIGYVELAYAKQNKLALASLRNHDGNFVKPSIESTSEAAAGVEVPADYRVSITDAKGAGSWPIAAFTYLLVHQEQPDAQKGKVLAEFLFWAVHEGQALAAPLDYAPLPKPLVAKLDKTLETLTISGKPRLSTAAELAMVERPSPETSASAGERFSDRLWGAILTAWAARCWWWRGSSSGRCSTSRRRSRATSTCSRSSPAPSGIRSAASPAR